MGTVVKSGEDEDPIGVVSPLNLHRYRDLEALQQIGAHLEQHCSNAEVKQQLYAVSASVGRAANSWIAAFDAFCAYVQDISILPDLCNCTCRRCALPARGCW